MRPSARAETTPDVAPEILQLVGDPGRPQQAVPLSRDLADLPGQSGFLSALGSLNGVLRHGEDYFSGLVQKHGPVFRHMLGFDQVVFVADPDLIWSMVRNEEGAWSAALAWYNLIGGIGGGGLGTLDFTPHRDLRGLLQPSFGSPAIAGYLTAAEEIFAPTMERWIREGGVGFKAEARRLFAMVSARIFMGIEDATSALVLDRATGDAWGAILAMRKRAILSPTWQRARRGTARLFSIMRSRVGGGTDLLSRLREAHDQAEWLRDEQTRLEMFIGILMAAFDTTANGVTSMAYLLAKHPDWQETLRAEAQALTSDRPSLDELKQLERTEWVWKETLRLLPVAGQLPRQALRETRLGPHRIPARAGVNAMLGSAMRDPRWWTNPLAFDPERFSPGRAEDRRHKAIFLPFGAGPHACIGAQLATVEAKAFWHAFLRRCRFRLRRDYTARHTYRPLGIVSGNVDLVLEPL